MTYIKLDIFLIMNIRRDFKYMRDLNGKKKKNHMSSRSKHEWKVHEIQKGKEWLAW